MAAAECAELQSAAVADVVELERRLVGQLLAAEPAVELPVAALADGRRLVELHAAELETAAAE